MDTKWGITALIIGGYLVAMGLAGINANSGGTVAIFAIVLVIGFVIGGWAIVLPWDGGSSRPKHDAPGPVAKP
jgi:hypothetical protein